jgi:hypothetical protein
MPYSTSGQYFPPAVRYTLGKPAPEFVSRPQQTFSRAVTGPGMTKGRTNGMPWDGTSPCTAGADPMTTPGDSDLARLEAYLHVSGDAPQDFRR